MTKSSAPSKLIILAVVLWAMVWLVGVGQWVWLGEWPILYNARPWGEGVLFGSSLLVGGWLAWQAWKLRKTNIARACLLLSIIFVLGWHFSVYLADLLVLDSLRGSLASAGVSGLFLIGLGWTVWLVERSGQAFERRRLQAASSGARVAKAWHPLNPKAWYFGRRSPKLNQSLIALFSYTFSFVLLVTLLSQTRGCSQIYELPAGGGQQVTVAQTVRVEKVIRKKYVVNPFSAIKFDVPPIDEVKLQLTELTQHNYTIGYGEGAGAGFAGGTQRGKVRFIRLEYSGGDWNQGFGVGDDLNMLLKYHELTSQKVADETESIRVIQLANFPLGKSPPFVYMTGQQSISFSNNEIKILREYLDQKHGMLFCDNGGSSHFHNQFVALMQKVLPDVRPVPIPLDDRIHRQPFALPFLPYVAPHGGKEALGWWKDGRWVCYYHPGDIGDAWADGNAGVDPSIWKACYELGTNVIVYANTEYSKWNLARTQRK
ncbi:MAG TPA: DUF4159 domain-containing protein [Pirellulaceae bacterium]|nr:DUF4159 domain-containing protein [Pirellulaceae bacterium]